MLSLIALLVCWNHPHLCSHPPLMSFLMYFTSGSCFLLLPLFFYLRLSFICSSPPHLLHTTGLALGTWWLWLQVTENALEPGQRMQKCTLTQTEAGEVWGPTSHKHAISSISPLLLALPLWLGGGCHLATGVKDFLICAQVWIVIGRERTPAPGSVLMALPKGVAWGLRPENQEVTHGLPEWHHSWQGAAGRGSWWHVGLSEELKPAQEGKSQLKFLPSPERSPISCQEHQPDRTFPVPYLVQSPQPKPRRSQRAQQGGVDTETGKREPDTQLLSQGPWRSGSNTELGRGEAWFG